MKPADVPLNNRASLFKQTEPPLLAESGWAAKALAMVPAWTVIDLFGATGDPEGDPHEIGLAVWLNGRRLLAMDEKCAVVREAGGWSYYHRRELRGAVPLWDLSR